MENQSNNKHVTLYTTLGWLCAVVSLIFIPVIFGAGGVIFGYLLARDKKTNLRGVIIIVFSIAFTILGMLMGAIVGSRVFG